MHFLRRLILCGHTGVDIYVGSPESGPRTSRTSLSKTANSTESKVKRSPNSEYRFADWSQPLPEVEPEQESQPYRVISKPRRETDDVMKTPSSSRPRLWSRSTTASSGRATRTSTASSGKELYTIIPKAEYQDKSGSDITELLQAIAEDESLVRVVSGKGDAAKKMSWYAALNKEQAWKVKNLDSVGYIPAEDRRLDANVCLSGEVVSAGLLEQPLRTIEGDGVGWTGGAAYPVFFLSRYL